MGCGLSDVPLSPLPFKFAFFIFKVLVAKQQTAIIAEREARLMIMHVQCGVKIWANVCMYVFKMSCYWARHVNLCVRTPGKICNMCSIKHFTSFVAVLIWKRHRRRVTGRGGSLPASRCMYIAPSIWLVNPSSVLKKLRNTGSKPTFDSIYRYRHSHLLSTETRLLPEVTL